MKSVTITGQIPIPVADKVAVIVPVAPAFGTITGVNVFSVPGCMIAGPVILQEYKEAFWTLAPDTVNVPDWQIVPLVPASTIGFGIMVNTNGLEAAGQTPFGEFAVNVSVTIPVWPVAGV